MKQIDHFIGGARVANASDPIPVFDPATGERTGTVARATRDDVDSAVAAAKAALPSWSKTGLQYRAAMMLSMRHALMDVRQELIGIVVDELGKTIPDAAAEVDRAIEILGQAASVGSWYSAPFTPGVSEGVDAYEVRYPIGVIAAISPFNFPILIPVVQSAMAIACGNTVVLKPSERDPSASLRVGELFRKAGLPDGVFNIIMGDRLAVDRLVEHPDVAGITFVGSTPVARAIRTAGVANNKRVQAFGGGKNHMVVMPDADLDMAADAAVSAAYGAAGQRCMAVSVVVAVEPVGDALVEKIAQRVAALKTGAPTEKDSQVGPVISQASLDNITSYIGGAEGEGAKLVADGRINGGDAAGWFVGPTLVDHVRPGMAVHSNEIFGPVLSVIRVSSYEEASAIIADHPLGNGAALFTQNAAIARRFVDETEAGQIGLNIPIPFPVFFHNFAGWKDSAFTETKLFGPGALAFCTRTKTVSARWPQRASSGINLDFPSSR